MKTIKASTRRGASFLQSYKYSTNFSLSDCYNKCSTAKTRAEYDCRRWMSQENGRGFKIISFNCNFFSCGWLTAAGLRVETVGGSYLVTL